MNSVIEQPTRAEVQGDPITQLVTQFCDGVRDEGFPNLGMSCSDGVRGELLHGLIFETVLLYRGDFGNASGFELIALETRHGGR